MFSLLNYITFVGHWCAKCWDFHVRAKQGKLLREYCNLISCQFNGRNFVLLSNIYYTRFFSMTNYTNSQHNLWYMYVTRDVGSLFTAQMTSQPHFLKLVVVHFAWLPPFSGAPKPMARWSSRIFHATDTWMSNVLFRCHIRDVRHKYMRPPVFPSSSAPIVTWLKTYVGQRDLLNGNSCVMETPK